MATPQDTAAQADSTPSGCVRPFLTKSGLTVRCQSRVRSQCPSCAELYRGDWAAIARSGVFDGPGQAFGFYLLTLMAPSSSGAVISKAKTARGLVPLTRSRSQSRSRNAWTYRRLLATATKTRSLLSSRSHPHVASAGGACSVLLFLQLGPHQQPPNWLQP